MASPGPNEIVVTGIGMQSSLGDAVTACAAARAGLSLARELDDLSVMADDGSETQVVGHPVESAAGFRGIGKLLNLAGAALQDLLEKSGAIPTAGLGIYLSAPEPGAEDDRPPKWTAQTLCSKLVARAPLTIESASCIGIADDGAGFGTALLQAVEALRTNRFQHCIVGSVDSLLESEIVDWLDRCDRLKTRDRPDGLRPSEGAAFVLLERHDSAAARGVEPMAVLSGCEVVESRDAPGDALASAITRVLANTGPTAGLWLLSDHNGETSSAEDLGHARVRLSVQHPDVADAPLWSPAESFGDTAGAAGTIALCAAAAAFARGYAPGSTALVTFTPNDDSRVAIRLDGARR